MLLFIIVVLAVFGAAAGAIGAAVFGLPELVGTLALTAAISLFVAFGNASVERQKRILAHGAELVRTDPLEGYDAALREAHRLRDSDPQG